MSWKRMQIRDGKHRFIEAVIVGFNYYHKGITFIIVSISKWVGEVSVNASSLYFVFYSLLKTGNYVCISWNRMQKTDSKASIDLSKWYDGIKTTKPFYEPPVTMVSFLINFFAIQLCFLIVYAPLCWKTGNYVCISSKLFPPFCVLFFRWIFCFFFF